MVQVDPRRPCAFCGQVDKLTREHLFRDSLRGRIPASSELARQRTDRNGFMERTDMPVSIFELKVREVCGPCNAGWMNDIDLQIEDVLVELANGARRDVPASYVAGIARWATRVALLRTLSERARSGQANNSLFQEFFETQLPPANTFIRIAALPHLAFEGGSNSHARFASQDSDAGSSLNVVSWGIGFLFVHVVLASDGEAVTIARYVDRALRRMNKTMPRVWPESRRAVTIAAPSSIVMLDHLSSVGFLLLGDKPAPIPQFD